MRKIAQPIPHSPRPWKEILKLLGTGAAVGGGLAVGGGAIGGLTEAVGRALTFQKNLKSTLKENPDLKKYEPGMVEKHFRTIHRFAPDVASDPMVAGAYLRGTLASADLGVLPQTVKALVDIQKGVTERKGGTFAQKAKELHRVVPFGGMLTT